MLKSNLLSVNLNKKLSFLYQLTLIWVQSLLHYLFIYQMRFYALPDLTLALFTHSNRRFCILYISLLLLCSFKRVVELNFVPFALNYFPFFSPSSYSKLSNLSYFPVWAILKPLTWKTRSHPISSFLLTHVSYMQYIQTDI